MADYERRQQVNAFSDELFDYLAQVQNLPRYSSAMTSAEPAYGDAARAPTPAAARSSLLKLSSRCKEAPRS
ncbi:MAG TPA: hypothetical protein VFW69_18365 [Mycobacterium sp.]|nr:hypothetical protein [Mycobacterium sp.]